MNKDKILEFLDKAINTATNDILGNLMATLYKDLRLRIKKGHFDDKK